MYLLLTTYYLLLTKVRRAAMGVLGSLAPTLMAPHVGKVSTLLEDTTSELRAMSAAMLGRMHPAVTRDRYTTAMLLSCDCHATAV